MIPFFVDICVISNVIFFAPSSISSIFYGFFFNTGKKFRFSDSENRSGGVEGKKNLNVCLCVIEKKMCECVVLFLALKLRYRLLQVFQNMSVNNG
jgi:hypothetical protein